MADEPVSVRLARGRTARVQLKPLHARFGVEVSGVDLRFVTAEHGFAYVRELFETHSLLLFRSQELRDEEHMRFASLFGALENRAEGEWGAPPAAPIALSNQSEDGAALLAERDWRLANLQANMQWHTDGTFLPTPSLVNVLASRVVPSQGGQTEVCSTRAAFADLPDALRLAAQSAVLTHSFAHSRALVDPELVSKHPQFTRWPTRDWRAVWRSPATGQDALYLASHVCSARGDGVDMDTVAELMAFATRDEYVYTHEWRPGDVLVWDERATMHRGRPWPYDEERSLSSVVASVGTGDGLESVQVLGT